MKGRKRKQKKKAKVVTGVPVPRSEFDLMARPFSLFADLQERMNQFFKLPFVFSPRVDVFQEGKTLIVKAEIPGIKKDEISVSISDDSVTLKGERKQAREQKGKGFYRSECALWKFSEECGLTSSGESQRGPSEVRKWNPRSAGS